MTTDLIRPGERFGRSVVLSESIVSERDGAYFSLRCDCGERFRMRRESLLISTDTACRTCRPRGRIASMARTCSACRESGHNVRTCPTREGRRGGRRCRECEGLPWRRDERGCFACEKPFAEEPPLTLADIFERPADDRRTLP